MRYTLSIQNKTPYSVLKWLSAQKDFTGDVEILWVSPMTILVNSSILIQVEVGYQCFGEPYCLHLQSEVTTWHHNPEDTDLNLYCCENLKYCISTLVSTRMMTHICIMSHQFCTILRNVCVQKLSIY